MVSQIRTSTHRVSKKESIVLLHFLYGQAKLAIWLSRKRKLNGEGLSDVMVLTGLIRSRVKIEFAFCKLTEDLEMFNFKWGVNNCICEATYDGLLNLYV